LRREVDSLLSSHEQAGTGFLKIQRESEACDAGGASRPGRRIGVYQIVEEIGHGGMGEVYRAVRADGHYTKKSPSNWVRGGYDSSVRAERFRNERRFWHRSIIHIARLLDGGTTEDGVPYWSWN